jgi:hypothetical protein
MMIFWNHRVLLEENLRDHGLLPLITLRGITSLIVSVQHYAT